MKIRTIFLLFVLILMAVFLVINWTALSTVTAVNLIYTEIQAPLGVLVVGGFAAVVFVLLVYMVWQQASVTLELRAAYKEARNARTVADDAEKSRYAESTRILLARIEKLEALMTARSDETLTAVRQEAVRAEERYKALFDDQKRAQGELTAQVQTQIGAMEKRVVETLPSAVSAAVPPQAAESSAASRSMGYFLIMVSGIASPEADTSTQRYGFCTINPRLRAVLYCGTAKIFYLCMFNQRPYPLC